MNFLNLYYFTVIAEELNITKAAQRLFVSQQTLSNHVMKLEKYLEVQLFNRTPTLSLTYAGTRFLRAANQILDIKRQIINEIDDINHHRRGELRIGISHTRGRVFLPRILPAFCEEHPFIDVTITEGNSQQLEEWLMHGRIDLLIGFAPILVNEVETINILKEHLLLIVPQKFMKELFPDNCEEMVQKFQLGVDMDCFKDCPYVMMSTANRARTIFDNYLNRLGITIHVIFELESIETCLELACQGMGLTVYPEMFMKSLSPLFYHDGNAPFYTFPLNDPSTIGNLVIGYHCERYLTDSARDFIKAALNMRKMDDSDFLF